MVLNQKIIITRAFVDIPKMASLSDSNTVRTHNHLVRKRTLEHLAKLASLTKWFSVRLQTRWFWVRIAL